MKALIPGIIRGLLADGFKAKAGQKLGDIDPRADADYTQTISDKGRTIAGGVLEAIMAHLSQDAAGPAGSGRKDKGG